MAQRAMQACSRVAQPLALGGWVGGEEIGAQDRTSKGTMVTAVELRYTFSEVFGAFWRFGNRPLRTGTCTYSPVS